MRESILVVVSIVALLATGALEPTTGIRGGLVAAVLSLAVGIIAGGLYHWKLHRSLAARDALPPRWWIQPTKLHDRLTEDERVETLPAFYVGATAFGFCVLGCVAMLSGIARI